MSIPFTEMTVQAVEDKGVYIDYVGVDPLLNFSPDDSIKPNDYKFSGRLLDFDYGSKPKASRNYQDNYSLAKSQQQENKLKT